MAEQKEQQQPMKGLSEYGDLEDPKGKVAAGNGIVTNMYNANPARFQMAQKIGYAVAGIGFIASLIRVRSKEQTFNPAPSNLKDGETVILYCGGWGVEGVYRRAVSLISSESEGEMRISRGPFPARPMNEYIAGWLFWIQIVMYISIFLGRYLSTKLFGVQRSEKTGRLVSKHPVFNFVEMVSNCKCLWFLASFLIGNILITVLTNTGAFEVYHSNEVVWSSLERGHMPSRRNLEASLQKSTSFQRWKKTLKDTKKEDEEVN